MLLSATALALLASAPAASPSLRLVDRANRGEKTAVHGADGKLLFVVMKYTYYWHESPDPYGGEYWVVANGPRWLAGLTHNTLGGSVGPLGTERKLWKVWERRTLKGSMVRRSTTRWDIYSRTGRFLAYTKGPHGGAAATYYLIFEVD